MHRWFSYRKYESFQRQLNIYGFVRVKKGTDKSSYYHKDFIRGQYFLAASISRVPVKKLPLISSIDQPSNPDVRTIATRSDVTTPRSIAMNTNDQLPTVNASRSPTEIDDIRYQQLIAALPVATQPYLRRNDNLLRSSSQPADINSIINRYICNSLINSAPTSSTSTSALPTRNNSVLPMIPPTRYDTDTLNRLELHLLQHANNQSVMDTLLSPLLPASTFASLPQQQPFGPPILSQFQRHQYDTLATHSRLISSSEMDQSTLVLNRFAARDQLDLLPSGASMRSHLQPREQQNQLVVDRLLSQRPTVSNDFLNALTNARLQPNAMNRRVPHDQTILDVILLLQQQFPASTNNEHRL